MQQLLFIETVLKLAGGLVLAVAPLAAIRLLGLPRTESAFWPRLLGAMLIGLAAATFIEARGGRGLGLAGSLLVNLSAAATLTALLVLQRASPTRRGRLALWLLVAVLTGLALFEIAHV